MLVYRHRSERSGSDRIGRDGEHYGHRGGYANSHHISALRDESELSRLFPRSPVDRIIQ